MDNLELYELLNENIKATWKNERDYVPDVTQLLKQNWYWTYKLTDASMGYKPFDAMACTPNGVLTAIEYKWEKRLSTDIWILRPNQKKALKEISDRWGRTAIVIFMERHNHFEIYSYRELEKH